MSIGADDSYSGGFDSESDSDESWGEPEDVKRQAQERDSEEEDSSGSDEAMPVEATQSQQDEVDHRKETDQDEESDESEGSSEVVAEGGMRVGDGGSMVEVSQGAGLEDDYQTNRQPLPSATAGRLSEEELMMDPSLDILQHRDSGSGGTSAAADENTPPTMMSSTTMSRTLVAPHGEAPAKGENDDKAEEHEEEIALEYSVDGDSAHGSVRGGGFSSTNSSRRASPSSRSVRLNARRRRSGSGPAAGC